ncbi:DUF6318 family protein [Actinomyces glycerinitolerans]|uniref:DUF6318 domain-containing protein n=1 Tax=Actinomyces glycerinitolerans TaxID=1892869 RepID=A0A1M4RWU9_9ACTO|nr:DUF6318 family protein [Actinomyces glycerinitolerans]SHE24177.1 Hypothetical protein ACGLYG10_0377 [Actinomyces glycerinitolerans]
MRRAAALATCLALLGAGCANAANRTTYTPTWTPPATASASATPTLSPEDAAARATALAMEPPAPYTPEFTPEGAATAATYFLNLYPYVYATGDLDAWQNMSDDNCEFCNSVINNVTELHDAGGWTDPWGQEITPLEWWDDDADPNRNVVRIQTSFTGHASHSGDGIESAQTNAADEILLIQMYWTGSTWSVEIVDIEDADD